MAEPGLLCRGEGLPSGSENARGYSGGPETCERLVDALRQDVEGGLVGGALTGPDRSDGFRRSVLHAPQTPVGRRYFAASMKELSVEV
jgi:hypothetical protein